MLYTLLIPIFSFFQFQNTTDNRIIIYRGEEYKTTISVAQNFIGTYKGRKAGYLELKSDGTGTYKYDIFGLAPASCKRTPITFEWGFLLDENNQIVKRKRDYGYSYPILFKSTSKTTFQGCRTDVMMDYIMDKKGVLNVSSSDDWKK
jgi:hypothetical protein